MKYSVIDIGSNSIRLTAYDTAGPFFRILFKEKIMAGLAGYVENGCLSRDGIRRACAGLLELRETLDALELRDRVSVFATASLRNICNTQEAVAEIQAVTGFPIEVVSGEEEALLGYTGAMEELHLTQGVFLDIGGASTEVAIFADQALRFSSSVPLGSLKLFREEVRLVLPTVEEQQALVSRVREGIPDDIFQRFGPQRQLACVGGTARTALKLARKVCGLSGGNRLTLAELCQVRERLCGEAKSAADLILKVEPERIHTILPGILILEHMATGFGVEEIIVSKYGVREGYLCRKLLHRI